MSAAGLVGTVRTWGRMVKFSHSVFALPFACAGAALAAAEFGIDWQQVLWIVLAMIGARNAAMGFNRLADQRFDAANPRTADRELPRGRLARSSVWAFTVLLAGLFVVATIRLGLAWLAPPALVVVLGYSYTKRFTWASHFVLGLALGLAPLGGWLAVAQRIALVPCLLGAAVLAWVAGFDVVYACQDAEFDRSTGLHSIPARFGKRRALTWARALHAAALVLLAAVGVAAGLHPIYWAGWVLIALLLVRQHRLVPRDDLSRVGAAFFDTNATVSVTYLAAVLAALAV